MTDVDHLTRKRVSILHRYFLYACDKDHPFQPEDLKTMRERFAINSKVQKVPDEDKWLLKLTDAFKTVLPASTSSQVTALYEAVRNIFDDNRAEFLSGRPEDSRLSLQPIRIPVGVPQRHALN